MFWFPRPTSPIYFPAYFGDKWLPPDSKFDQYEGAPMYKSMRPYHDEYKFVMEPYYQFCDYGWRLQFSFHQMFYLDDPVHVLNHIMAVGVANDYDPSW